MNPDKIELVLSNKELGWFIGGFVVGLLSTFFTLLAEIVAVYLNLI